MDYAERILTLTTTIKKMVDTVKSNKEYCSRIADRVKAVEGLVLNIRQRDPSQISDTVDGALRELYVILNSAKTLMAKFSQTKAVKGFFKSGSIEEKFNEVNQRLTENFQVLSGALQIEHTNMLQKVYEAVSRQSTEEEVCSMMANTTLTPPMFPPAPVSSPTVPMPQPAQVSSPTVPMLPFAPMPSPTVPMPQPAQVSSPSVPMFQPAPVSHPQHPQLPPTPISNPTSPIFSSIPVSNPTAAMPVTYVMSPMSVSTPYVRQPVYNTTTPRFIVTNNIASRPVMQAISQGSVTGIRTVTPITLPAQNRPIVSAYVVKNAFLR
ncbi:calphotin-like isoform X1 [Oreochromis niloticus]|uniref:calphotin-like isoform X1 n=1 Tax=Oreochromis niloticus TaxID=8128 RepID=UPI0009048283|nr:calphotin-like isoform X1 [Oreochromis niloticus]XP_019216396.1 calphotin-like isoform X1 [Oreochromis niloticus]XP_019216397.1 calphotin-like isoform X1 [Oreochromis niloticus]XP_019216398.1 calphotin-like isoform X1 [Oreochromis niloticus]XP_025765263.1 calphotin-like isoform X1 [Oreochromis niloticus]